MVPADRECEAVRRFGRGLQLSGESLAADLLQKQQLCNC